MLNQVWRSHLSVSGENLRLNHHSVNSGSNRAVQGQRKLGQYLYLSSSPLSCPLFRNRHICQESASSIYRSAHQNTVQYLFSACLSWEQQNVWTSFHLNKQTAEQINENYRLCCCCRRWKFKQETLCVFLESISLTTTSLFSCLLSRAKYNECNCQAFI